MSGKFHSYALKQSPNSTPTCKDYPPCSLSRTHTSSPRPSPKLVLIKFDTIRKVRKRESNYSTVHTGRIVERSCLLVCFFESRVTDSRATHSLVLYVTSSRVTKFNTFLLQEFQLFIVTIRFKNFSVLYIINIPRPTIFDSFNTLSLQEEHFLIRASLSRFLIYSAVSNRTTSLLYKR